MKNTLLKMPGHNGSHEQGTAMVVPDVAIRWMVQNMSNVELANLSNVNKHWREIVLAELQKRDNDYLIASAILGNRTACLAWFPPEGIQVIRGTVMVSSWHGYRNAYQILAPFGYTRNFIDDLLSIRTDSQPNSVSSVGEDQDSTYTTDLSSLKNSAVVSGASIARPDKYCLCWDDVRSLSMELKTERRRLQRQRLPCRVDRDNNKVSCVQFLTFNGKHATRLQTPPFEPGPVYGPVTMFCVAIATEDGCFLSGLTSRHELGHHYPRSARDELIDMSPVCISVDDTKPQHRVSVDEISANTSDEELLKCSCAFKNIQKMFSDADDSTSHTVSGKMGPGRWHCYVAIFDGEDSLIRVDGVEQPLTGDTLPELCSPLDGLTIGSDHIFDMSLCLGDGEEGEGEGAIGEVAVFNGRLALSDIYHMEKYLMMKHAIFPSSMEENEWRLQAHALITQPAPWRFSGEPVPLRMAARHPSVAWERINAVTGEEENIARIGSRSRRGSSSEW